MPKIQVSGFIPRNLLQIESGAQLPNVHSVVRGHSHFQRVTGIRGLAGWPDLCMCPHWNTSTFIRWTSSYWAPSWSQADFRGISVYLMQPVQYLSAQGHPSGDTINGTKATHHLLQSSKRSEINLLNAHFIPLGAHGAYLNCSYSHCCYLKSGEESPCYSRC